MLTRNLLANNQARHLGLTQKAHFVLIIVQKKLYLLIEYFVILLSHLSYHCVKKCEILLLM